MNKKEKKRKEKKKYKTMQLNERFLRRELKRIKLKETYFNNKSDIITKAIRVKIKRMLNLFNK